MSASNTFAPLAAAARAVAAPNPDAPPVMMMTLPDKSMFASRYSVMKLT
jgi:hypothetical protein